MCVPSHARARPAAGGAAVSGGGQRLCGVQGDAAVPSRSLQAPLPGGCCPAGSRILHRSCREMRVRKWGSGTAGWGAAQRRGPRSLPRLPGGHLTAPCTWLHFCTAPAFSIPVQPAGFLLQAARAGSGAGRMRFLCLHDVEAPRPAADIWQGAGSRASPCGHRGTPGAGPGHSSLAAWCRRGQGRTLRPRCWVQGGRELPEPCSQTFPCPPR